MNENLLKILKIVSLVLSLGVSINASASFLGFGEVRWKEEALQNDGSTIMVTRSQSHGGRHQIGQIPPIKEQSLTFTLPHSDKVITWKDEATSDVGYANFDVMALYVLHGTPYLVTSPDKCLAYNKWGRPNPPYVFFKYDGASWQRIPLSEFPTEFKNFNLITSTPDDENELTSQSPIQPDIIRKFNNRLTQPEYRTILRTSTFGRDSETSCINMVSDGRNGWLGIDWFTHQTTLNGCLNVCRLQRLSPQYCPCNSLFKGK